MIYHARTVLILTVCQLAAGIEYAGIFAALHASLQGGSIQPGDASRLL